MSEKQPKKKKTAGDVVLTVVLIAAICIFCYAGYFFGDLPFVQENLKLLIVAIIFISILPAVIEVIRAKLKF